MKNLNSNFLITLLLFFVSIFGFAGCEIIGDIFKAGLWVGIIIVVLIVALILWILRKIRR